MENLSRRLYINYKATSIRKGKSLSFLNNGIAFLVLFFLSYHSQAQGPIIVLPENVTFDCVNSQTFSYNVGAGDVQDQAPGINLPPDPASALSGSHFTQGGGIMFDITPSSSMIITSFDVYPYIEGTATHTFFVDVYYKRGTRSGFESNAGAWTLAGTTSFSATANNNFASALTNANFGTIPLLAGETYAIWIRGRTPTAGSMMAVSSNSGAVSSPHFTTSNHAAAAGIFAGANIGGGPYFFEGGINYILAPFSNVAQIAGLPSGSTFPAGTTTNTFTATDLNGNTSTKSFTVTVNQDTQPPTITAPPSVTASTNAGTCVATGVALGTPIVNDNCGTVIISNNAPATFAIGSTPVTWTATDASGITATATQTVIVTDNINPTITAPPNRIANTNSGCTATGVALGTPTGTDNCATPTFTNNAPAAFPIGVTIVIWTANDGNGNTATATQTVTVLDNISPAITAPPNITVSANAGTCVATGVALGTPTGTDNCGIPTFTNNAPATFPIGVTTVIWTANDGNGNTQTAFQTVTVTDNVIPTITAPINVTANTNSGCTATGVALGTPTGTDNCGTPTFTNNAPAAFPIGVTIVIWTATDLGGNTATATQMVTVSDNVSPTITAPPNSTVSTNAGSCVATGVALGTPTGIDNCGTPTFTNNAPATFPIGITTVIWTAADGNGNTATAPQTVTVTDNIIPTITAPIAVTVNTDAGLCTASGVVLGAATGSDNCGTPTITNNAPAIFPAGTTTVIWTATDPSGNTATAAQIVTVNENQNPTITAPINVTANTNSGCTATGVALGTPTGTDNCGTPTFTNNAPTAFPIGVTTVTWTATDPSGNTATATQIVTVSDSQNPTITAPANIAVSTNAGSCTATGVALGTPTANDNCGIPTFTNNAPATFSIGTTTVTWTATDASGNTATAIQTVTVLDNTIPTITAPSDVTANTDAGSCTASGVILGTATGIDNCGTPTFTNNSPTIFPAGTTTVTWTANDGNGNTATATQLVTVSDNQSPVVVAQVDYIRTTDIGNCTFTNTNIPNGTATDNCSVSSYSYVLTGATTGIVSTLTNQVLNVGITTVTWSATDVNGNTSTTDNFTIIVNDTKEIDVLGNSVSILDGSTTPSTTDDTDFGSVTLSSTITYTLSNSGTEAISISSITSDNAEFVINNVPTTVAAGATASFDVIFTPTTVATQTAIITINNNDCNEAVYDFVVRGQKPSPIPPLAAPPAPTNFRAMAISTTQINLNWQNTTQNVTSYRLYSNSILIATLPNNATRYEVVGLIPDSFYSFNLIAVNERIGEVKLSNPASDNEWTFPENPTLLSISTVCGMGKADLRIEGSGTIFRVYNRETNGDLVSESRDGRFDLPSVESDSVFYVSVVGRSGKESERTAINVEVQDIFEAIILGETTRISCENAIELTAQEVENATYTWYWNGIDLNLNTQTITANRQGNYQVFVQKGVCSFMSEKVTLKLNQLPVARIKERNGIEFCQNGVINAISVGQNATYEWLLNNEVIGNNPSQEVTQSGRYTLEVTNENGCQASAEIEVVITNIPQTPVMIATESTICPNRETTLSIQNIENGVIYQWFRNGRNLRETGSSISTSVQGSYQVRAFNSQNGGCSSVSNKVEINRFEVLPVYLRVSEDRKSLLLEDVNLSQDEIASVEWYFDGELKTDLGSEFEITPIENGYYSAKIINQSGCTVQTRTVYFSVPKTSIVTGREELRSDVFNIYPNPSNSGVFNIHFGTVLLEDIQITVFDGIGRIIQTATFTKGSQDFKINLQTNPNGMYLVRFNQNQSSYTKQIVIE